MNSADETRLWRHLLQARGSKLLEFLPPLFAAFFVPPFVSTLLPVPSGFLAATAFPHCSHGKGMHKDRKMCRTVFLLYLQLVFVSLEAPVTHRFPPRLISLVIMKPQRPPKCFIWPHIGTKSGGAIRSAPSHASSIELTFALPRSREAAELKSPAMMSALLSYVTFFELSQQAMCDVSSLCHCVAEVLLPSPAAVGGLRTWT